MSRHGHEVVGKWPHFVSVCPKPRCVEVMKSKVNQRRCHGASIRSPGQETAGQKPPKNHSPRSTSFCNLKPSKNAKVSCRPDVCSKTLIIRGISHGSIRKTERTSHISSISFHRLFLSGMLLECDSKDGWSRSRKCQSIRERQRSLKMLVADNIS